MALDIDSKTNLIVNYLPQTLTDEEFRSMFLSIGPIRSCKIIRDKTSGYSYGFGFVDYTNEADAYRAIDTMNGLQMDTKRLKVALAKQEVDDSKITNIYVKNIPKEYTEKELNALFEVYGRIVTSKVMMDLQTGESRTVGFVQFATREESDKAIAHLNGKAPPGQSQPLYLKYADDGGKKLTKAAHVMPPQAQPLGQPQGGYSILANRFPTPGQGGPMRNPAASRFRYNPLGGATTGFSGTSTFTAQTSTVSNGAQSGNDQAPKGPGPYVIFVYNIGNDAEDRELWALFSPFGSVQKVNVMWDHGKNQCKGFGFVTMPNLHEASHAISCLHNSLYKGRQLSVSFKK